MATALRTSGDRQQRAETLRQMKQKLYNANAAEAARQSAQATPNRFDAHAFLAYVTDHPVFSKLHMVSKDDE